MTINTPTPLALASRIIFLAWKASRVVGMGILQDRGELTEDQVWDIASNSRDYVTPRSDSPTEIYCDYVAGRMMKLGLKWDKKSVIIEDNLDIDVEYQSWGYKYLTHQSLVDAAVSSLEPTT